MGTIDLVILAIYAIGLFGIAQWVSRDSGQAKTTEDYFLAGGRCLGGRLALP